MVRRRKRKIRAASEVLECLGGVRWREVAGARLVHDAGVLLNELGRCEVARKTKVGGGKGPRVTE